MQPVVIWVSHILVRHAWAADEESFSFANWHSVAPPSGRTKGEALARARELAEQARQQPGRFAELARLNSEDITNREYGGSLGGLRASQLTFWPQVLDALSAIRTGEVSEPVETRFGFHVFLRQPPPTEETVAGEHIVISHDGVKWSHMASCKDALPQRTREEALALARQIFSEVQAHPESFADAVQRYSDDCDASTGGDFGSWSTREVAPFERRLEVLRTLRPGETAPPRETHVGFEVIRRVPERPRQRFAAQLMSFQFNPWVVASDASSSANAFQKAREVARALQEDALRFAEFQTRYCCPESFVWEEGREPPGLRRALANLAPGEVSTQPVRVPGSFVLAKRLDPTELAVPIRETAALELPSPERVSLQSLVAASDLPRDKLSELFRSSSRALGLAPTVAEKLGALLEDWAATTGSLDAEQRHALLESALDESRALLNDDTLYARYQAALDEGMAELVLSNPMPMF